MAGFPAENTIEIRRIGESAHLADPVDRQVGIPEQFQCMSDPAVQESFSHRLMERRFISGEEIASGISAFCAQPVQIGHFCTGSEKFFPYEVEDDSFSIAGKTFQTGA